MLGRSVFQLNLMRAKLLSRLTYFTQAITVQLPKNYGVTLKGSWANAEHHVAEEDGPLRSYSDIDFVSEWPMKPENSDRLKTELNRAAATCGLQIRGCSIRPVDEMRFMWAVGRRKPEERRYRVDGEFIQFWTLIGAAELCSTWLLSTTRESSEWRYHLNKFFLSIWWDMGIVSGYRIRSYRDTLLFAGRWLTADICCASYGLKLGSKTTYSWEIVRSVHEHNVLENLRRFITSPKEYGAIRATITQLTDLNTSKMRRWAGQVLDDAKALEGGLRARRVARLRLVQKLLRA